MAAFIDDPRHEELGRTSKDVAALIVDGFHELIMKGVSDAGPDLMSGPLLELELMATFKSTLTDKIYHVGWMDDTRAWLVAADSRYGVFCPLDADFLRCTKPSTAKAGAPGNNAAGWKVGDKVIAHRGYKATVVATGDKCVLLDPEEHGLYAVPNDDMENHYKKAAFDSGLFDN